MEKIMFERNNKWNVPSLSQIRKEMLSKEEDRYCRECNRKHNRNSLQIDHILPAVLGGDLKFKESKGTDRNNYQILCYYCHGKKTGKDKTIINAFQKLGLIEKSFTTFHSYCSPKMIEMIYFYCYRKLEEKKTRDETW